MTAKELISGAVISLRPGDIGSDALSLMDELRVSHLPVVNDLEFLGLSRIRIFTIKESTISLHGIISSH